MNTLITPFSDHRDAILHIRKTVFTLEQHVDESSDLDGEDDHAIHALATIGDAFVATARILADGHIGRVAVLKEHRGKGIGAKIVMALIDDAKHRGIARVYLGAQLHAQSFYEKLGFTPYGDVYMDTAIEHICMELFINECSPFIKTTIP